MAEAERKRPKKSKLTTCEEPTTVFSVKRDGTGKLQGTIKTYERKRNNASKTTQNPVTEDKTVPVQVAVGDEEINTGPTSLVNILTKSTDEHKNTSEEKPKECGVAAQSIKAEIQSRMDTISVVKEKEIPRETCLMTANDEVGKISKFKLIDFCSLNKNKEMELNIERNGHEINQFSLTCDEIKMYADKIPLTNEADRILYIHVMNNLGKYLKNKEIQCLLDIKINFVLKEWSFWSSKANRKGFRQEPMCYLCSICLIGFWHLGPLRTHILTRHTVSDIEFHLRRTVYNYTIVAYEKSLNEVKSFNYTIQSKCWKCNKGYDEHAMRDHYECKGCVKYFKSCLLLRKHEGTCQPYRNMCTVTNTFVCKICELICFSEAQLNEHMTLSHIVRSDIPTSSKHLRSCFVCKENYFISSIHCCSKIADTKICRDCMKSFPNLRFARIHYKENATIMRCRFCAVDLLPKCREAIHLLQHTSNYILTYRCMLCVTNTYYPDMLSVVLHIKEFHEPMPRCYSSTLEECANIKSYAGEIMPRKCVERYFKSKINNQTAVSDAQAEQPLVTPIISEVRSEIQVQIKQEITEEEPQSMEELREIEILENIKVETKEEDTVENNHDEKLIEYHSKDVNDKLNDKTQQNKTNDNNGIDNVNHKSNNNDKVEVYPSFSVNIKQEVVENNDENVPEIETLVIIENLEMQREAEDIDEEIARVFRPSQSLLNFLRKSVSSTQEDVPYIKIKDEPMSEEDVVIDVTIPETTAVNDTQESSFNSAFNQNISDDDDDSDGKLQIDLKIRKRKPTSSSSKIRKRNKMYKCIKCNFEGLHKDFKRHKRTICTINPWKKPESANKYKCSECDIACHSLGKFIEHQVCHGLKKYTCPQCLIHFNYSGEVVAHVNGHIKAMFCVVNKIIGNTGVRFHECRNCKAIVQIDDYFSHWERHLHLDVKPIIQTVKPLSIKAPDKAEAINDPDMLNNVLRLLQLGTSQLRHRFRMCIVCDRPFKRNSDCKRHMIEHLLSNAYSNMVEDGGLRCQICFGTFGKSDQYKYHMREHASLPAYKCDLCSKTFSDSSNFSKHKKVHNLSTCICDYCNKKFQIKLSLEKHINEVHMEAKPIICTICPRMFYMKSELTRHVRNVHEKRAPKFVCLICRDVFTSLRNKWDHMWYAHQQRKFEADCPICHESFRKFHDVKQHIREKHDFDSMIKLRKSELEMWKKKCSDH